MIPNFPPAATNVASQAAPRCAPASPSGGGTRADEKSSNNLRDGILAPRSITPDREGQTYDTSYLEYDAVKTMIHEKQVRQLCAVHSVNNLLQLPSELGLSSNRDDCDCDHAKESDDDNDNQGLGEPEGGCTADKYEKNAASITHDWTCRGKILHPICSRCTWDTPNLAGGDSKERQKRQWRVATQDEFNDIAEEFTLREQMLMLGDESTFLSATSSSEEVKSGGISQDRLNKKLSLFQRLRSQYGTPYFGNYSLEVIEEALNRRGVELEFYRVPNDTHHAVPFKDDNGTTSSSLTSNKCLLGFIIYEKEGSRRSELSFFSRIGSHIPIIKHLFGVGQHWYAITGVKHSQYPSPNSPDRNDFNNDSSWFLIDSKMSDMPTFQTDKDLMDYAWEVQHRGGLIFCALFTENRISENVAISGD